MTNDEALQIMCKRCINREQCMGTGCNPKQTLEKALEALRIFQEDQAMTNPNKRFYQMKNLKVWEE